jgi:hypothetical protein
VFDYAECHYAGCCSAECCYSECGSAIKIAVFYLLIEPTEKNIFVCEQQIKSGKPAQSDYNQLSTLIRSGKNSQGPHCAITSDSVTERLNKIAQFCEKVAKTVAKPNVFVRAHLHVRFRIKLVPFSE